MACCEHFWNFDIGYDYEKYLYEDKKPPDDNFGKNNILDNIVTYPDDENGYCITLRDEIELRVNKIFKNKKEIKLNKNYYNNLNSINKYF